MVSAYYFILYRVAYLQPALICAFSTFVFSLAVLSQCWHPLCSHPRTSTHFSTLPRTYLHLRVHMSHARAFNYLTNLQYTCHRLQKSVFQCQSIRRLWTYLNNLKHHQPRSKRHIRLSCHLATNRRIQHRFLVQLFRLFLLWGRGKASCYRGLRTINRLRKRKTNFRPQGNFTQFIHKCWVLLDIVQLTSPLCSCLRAASDLSY